MLAAALKHVTGAWDWPLSVAILSILVILSGQIGSCRRDWGCRRVVEIARATDTWTMHAIELHQFLFHISHLFRLHVMKWCTHMKRTVLMLRCLKGLSSRIAECALATVRIHLEHALGCFSIVVHDETQILYSYYLDYFSKYLSKTTNLLFIT